MSAVAQQTKKIIDTLSEASQADLFHYAEFLAVRDTTKQKHPVILEKTYLFEPDPSKKPVIGKYNGMAKIPDDFNEPLDDMMEYMY
ncbi:MAG: DUF2281 domain-containing protein [Defluviitaleaceae bacterium]|nr:DUF2281 domain-containing protein [Defluviitaleaceae bacterium]MCL2274302.1 DUF2281 domain-containing protein [Defluviitaleaceae bacterium]